MVSTPQMGDYPPGCDGLPEERPMTEEEECDQIADEIGDAIFDFRAASSVEAMQELQDIIIEFIEEHQ